MSSLKYGPLFSDLNVLSIIMWSVLLLHNFLETQVAKQHANMFCSLT